MLFIPTGTQKETIPTINIHSQTETYNIPQVYIYKPTLIQMSNILETRYTIYSINCQPVVHEESIH